jgi:hypothetical protein
VEDLSNEDVSEEVIVEVIVWIKLGSTFYPAEGIIV